MSNERDVASESEGQKVAWIEEHLAYELLMLRYLHPKLAESQRQMDWNAFFVAFSVYARNLDSFLTNGDTQNLKASDFVPRFKAGKTDDTKGAFQRLRDQVFHLGKSRPQGKSDKKADLEDAKAAFDWIEMHFAAFIGQLDQPYRSQWSWSSAEASNYVDVLGSVSTSSLPGTIVGLVQKPR